MNNNSNESVKNTKEFELDAIIKDVKIQIRKHYAGYKEQIERIGYVLKAKKLIKEEDICTEIIIEEIKEKIILSDTIELCRPDEWKRKTKRKDVKDPQLRFFEDKNSQEQGTVTNVNTNLTSEGQILQQESEPDESKKIQEQKPEELARGLSKKGTTTRGCTHTPRTRISRIAAAENGKQATKGRNRNSSR